MTEPHWYRRIDAIARFRIYGGSSPFRTLRVMQEEEISCSYPEHLGRVAELLERSGIDDDMGDGATITFHVSYRGER